MPVKAKPIAYSWTGLYLGVHGGYGWGNTQYDFPANFGGFLGVFAPFPGGGSFDQTLSGGVFGGHVGYNYQVGNWVFGLEASISKSWLKATTTDPFLAAGIPPTATYTTKVDWYASATPRLGFAWDHLLFYGKGGIAFAKVDSTLTSSSLAPGYVFDKNAHMVGWTVGAGIEYALTPNWIVGAEYNYFDFGSASFGGWPRIGALFLSAGSYKTDVTFSTGTARLSYKFGNSATTAYAAAESFASATPVWTGFYGGLHGGYGWGDTTYDFPTLPPGTGFGGLFAPILTGGSFSQTLTGGLFGGHLGFNYQFGRVVVGLESALTWSGMDGKSSNPFGALFAAGSIATYDSKLKWLASVTPRLGYAFGDWLPYVKGGLAAGRVETSLLNTFTVGNPASFSQTRDHIGWTLGGGVDYALNSHWLVGLEYNYYDLGTQRYGGVPFHTIASLLEAGEYDVHPKFSSVMARLSYKP